MAWALFVIALSSEQYFVKYQGHYSSMEDCFEAREAIVLQLGDPPINYQAVCIQQDNANIL